MLKKKAGTVFIMLFITAAILFGTGPLMEPAYAANGAWPIIDGNGDNGLNAVPAKSAFDVQAAI